MCWSCIGLLIGTNLLTRKVHLPKLIRRHLNKSTYCVNAIQFWVTCIDVEQEERKRSEYWVVVSCDECSMQLMSCVDKSAAAVLNGPWIRLNGVKCVMI